MLRVKPMKQSGYTACGLKRPRNLIWQLAILTAFVFYSTSTFFRRQVVFEAGKISPLLHNQALSHFAFHSDPLKLHLASLFSPAAIGIVGVEWGEDVRLFAKNNYHVYAFEAASKFAGHLQKRLASQPWNVTLVHAAAGENDGEKIELRYGPLREEVQVKRVDSYISERLAVLSVDIQGNELDVLKGSTQMLRNDLVDSIWIEVGACNPKVENLLDLLGDDYIMFDFVPWGRHLGDESTTSPSERNSFAFYTDRPSGFQEYLTWMCDLKQSSFRWLQTDFLMVRRELITGKLVRSLQRLSSSQCGKDGINCNLRNILGWEGKSILR